MPPEPKSRSPHRNAGAERQSLAIAPIKLSTRFASALALAIHELLVNSIEAGALSQEMGHIAISAHQDDGRLEFEWAETSRHPQPGTTGFDAFGQDYLERGLAYDLQATTSLFIRDDSLRFALSASLSRPTL